MSSEAPTYLSALVEQALQAQARAIINAVINGNWSTARAMLRQVPDTRKCYIVMWLYEYAGEPGAKNSVDQLIMQVTE
jgi:hypothetical protein